VTLASNLLHPNSVGITDAGYNSVTASVKRRSTPSALKKFVQCVGDGKDWPG